MDFQSLVEQYKSRSSSALVDSIAAGLSYADELSVDVGLLSDTGMLDDVLGAVSVALPFAIIAVTEGGKAVLGHKTGRAAVQDAGYRVIKTGAAMGAGAAAAGLGAGFLPAIPVAMGVRMALDRYRSRMLTRYRVSQRIRRLEALRQSRAEQLFQPALPEAV